MYRKRSTMRKVKHYLKKPLSLTISHGGMAGQGQCAQSEALCIGTALASRALKMPGSGEVRRYLKGPLLLAISDGWMPWQGYHAKSET